MWLELALRCILIGVSLLAVVMMISVWSAVAAFENRKSGTVPVVDRALSGQGNALRYYRVEVERVSDAATISFKNTAVSRALVADVGSGRATHAVVPVRSEDRAFDVRLATDSDSALRFAPPALPLPLGSPWADGERAPFRAGDVVHIVAF